MGYGDNPGVIAVRDDPLPIEVYTVNLDPAEVKLSAVALVYLDLLQTKGVAYAACCGGNMTNDGCRCNELHS